jgi:dephospho-CoA kinase
LTPSGWPVFGLAGKAAAGKDTLLPVFVRRGFLVIDADRLGHEAREDLAPQVLARFGTTERKALGAMVFADPGALADLNALTHPWIRQRIVQALETAEQPVVVHAALLAQLHLGVLLDTVLWVRAPLWTRLLRARGRDKRSWLFVLRRVWAQRKLRSQDFGQSVDIHTVENPARPALALAALDELLGRLMSVFPERKP